MINGTIVPIYPDKIISNHGFRTNDLIKLFPAHKTSSAQASLRDIFSLYAFFAVLAPLSYPKYGFSAVTSISGIVKIPVHPFPVGLYSEHAILQRESVIPSANQIY